jgi:glutamine synthetase
MSLWDAEYKNNVFAGDLKIGDHPKYPTVSQEFLWFLGGWLKYAPDIMPFLAPTVNSYKRYQAGSFAPTAIAWSYDNRTAGFRVIGSGKSLRIETRIPGADVNPYLSYAALMAAGLEGIRERIDPPQMFTGDLYTAQDLAQVPTTLRDSIASLEQSAFIENIFGKDVFEHYLHFFKTEQALYDRAVTDWERKRYFEQI